MFKIHSSLTKWPYRPARTCLDFEEEGNWTWSNWAEAQWR